jgi:hypothetical protein
MYSIEKVSKINYKTLYINEKKEKQNLETILAEKIKEIEELNKKLEYKNTHIDETKQKILSYTNSITAKNGYKEEELICNDLNKNNNLHKIVFEFIGNEYDNCSRISGNHKCDIKSNNKTIIAQVKKYKTNQFQQLDRHWIDDFIKYIPELEKVSFILKEVCEYPLLPNGTHVDKSKSLKKLCLTNYSQFILDNLISNLNENKKKILNYAFYGINKEMQPEYLFGVEYINDKRTKIIVFKIKDIITYLENLEFKITKGKTVIVLGDDNIISLQRKGGDGGKKSSNQLQIKIILSKLLNKVLHIQYIL